MQRRLQKASDEKGITLIKYRTPYFLNSPQDLDEYFEQYPTYFQIHFYVHQRQKRNRLLEQDDKSIGGGYLLVAFTAGNQVVKIPVDNTDSYSIVSLDAPLNRPDGLLLSKDGKQLIVVNNAGGGEGKVLSFMSNDKWASGILSSSFSTGPVFPTTATSNGKEVFVLYAYLNRRPVGQSVFTIQEVPLNDTRPSEI